MKDTMIKLPVLDPELWRGAGQWRQKILQQEEHIGSKHWVCSIERRVVKATGCSSVVYSTSPTERTKEGRCGEGSKQGNREGMEISRTETHKCIV